MEIGTLRYIQNLIHKAEAVLMDQLQYYYILNQDNPDFESPEVLDRLRRIYGEKLIPEKTQDRKSLFQGLMTTPGTEDKLKIDKKKLFMCHKSAFSFKRAHKNEYKNHTKNNHPEHNKMFAILGLD